MEFDKIFLEGLFKQAEGNPRLRQNYDLRTSENDHSQRMLNALLPGTEVPVHCHPQSSENVICLCGRFDEVIYEMEPNATSEGFSLKEVARYHISPSDGHFGCKIPAGAWHKVEVFEPSVIYEAKDGRYNEDGSLSIEDYRKKLKDKDLSLGGRQCIG